MDGFGGIDEMGGGVVVVLSGGLGGVVTKTLAGKKWICTRRFFGLSRTVAVETIPGFSQSAYVLNFTRSS